jgi:4-amino-4-deoxy-L-arabinose transferase-like glycosyltransferase
LSNRSYYALAVLLLLVASALRLWNLPIQPIGFSDAELTQIDLLRDEIQRGNIRVFYELDNPSGEAPIGQEGLYHSVLALTSVAFGTGTFGLRILSFFAGILTIALMYTLGVRLFGRIGGIAAAGLLAVMLWMVLLSRLVLVETVLPLYITAVLLSLARAMPVYQRNRVESSNTLDFATLGTLLGLGLYLHPSSLFVLLLAMAFIVYCIILRRPLSGRRLSYIGFAILMIAILAIPYFVSTLRLPELDANGRLFGSYGSIRLSIYNSFLGLFLQGDNSPLYGLPQHPLLDPVSAILVLIGFVASIRLFREPRYALVLLAAMILAPPAILGGGAPNYLAISLYIPVIALFFGMAVYLLIKRMPEKLTWLGGLGLFSLLAGHFVWTSIDFFRLWPSLEEVQLAYNSDIGQIAHYLDLTAETIPTVVCYSNWDVERSRNRPLGRTELLLLHMNNDKAPLRYVDCLRGFVFINAGSHQQVVIANPDLYEQLPPSVADWIGQGAPLPDLPEGSVVSMFVQAPLLNLLGEFTTTTPASFETDENVSAGVPVAPPIRFGGNMTWLGYETDPNPVYTPNSDVLVTTYWRVEEGVVPPDLVIFTHILSDPVTPVANRDTIAVNPAQLEQADIYLHIAEIHLATNLPARNYVVSIGLNQSTSSRRLPVFENGEERGNRLFLYAITVQEP